MNKLVVGIIFAIVVILLIVLAIINIIWYKKNNCGDKENNSPYWCLLYIFDGGGSVFLGIGAGAIAMIYLLSYYENWKEQKTSNLSQKSKQINLSEMFEKSKTE